MTLTNSAKPEDLLAELAKAAFGLLSTAPTSTEASPTFAHDSYWISVAVLNHPAQGPFTAAVIADSELARFFPSSDSFGPVGAIVTSTGNGILLQASVFASVLIGSAYHWIRGSSECSADGLAQKSVSNLAIARRLMKRDRVILPTRVAFTNVILPPESVVHTPWGELRPAGDEDRDFAPSSLRHARSHSFGPGEETVTVQDSGDVVLDGNAVFTIRVGDSLEDAQTPPSSSDWRTQTQRAIQDNVVHLQLAFLLAIRRQPPVLPLPTWRAFYDPFNFLAVNSWTGPPGPSAPPPRKVTAQDADSIQEWSSLIGQSHQRFVAVATRRALMAAAERGDPGDRLIDAVIGWENLFGSGQGEPTFRISGAMAWLLEAEPEARSSLQAEIASLCGLRSQLVHGGAPDPKKLLGASMRALDLLVEALRTLYKSRPDLIGREDRGKLLMLGR